MCGIMPKLSIISHFYNHPDKVLKQVAHWNRIPAQLLEHIEFILVDDCSEEIPEIDKGALNLRVFRIDSDIPWNQAGARNLGIFNAVGTWGLLFDIDQLLDLAALPTLVASLDSLSKDTLYYLRINGLFNTIDNVPVDNHINTYLVDLARFRVMAMYDEDFAGHYGYEDIYVPMVWEANGGKRVLLSSPVFFSEDMGFRTGNLDRSLERNLQLLNNKLAAGRLRPQSILRFAWHEVVF